MCSSGHISAEYIYTHQQLRTEIKIETTET